MICLTSDFLINSDCPKTDTIGKSPFYAVYIGVDAIVNLFVRFFVW